MSRTNRDGGSSSLEKSARIPTRGLQPSAQRSVEFLSLFLGGSELLTDVPFWWGGAYIAGWAFRPVRVEASAFDPLDGAVVWNETEAVVYLWGRLKEVPEGERKKKEVQLGLNLKKAMEDIGDSLVDAGLTISALRMRRLPAAGLSGQLRPLPLGITVPRG